MQATLNGLQKVSVCVCVPEVWNLRGIRRPAGVEWERDNRNGVNTIHMYETQKIQSGCL